MSGPSGFEPVQTPPPEPARPMWPWALLAVAVVVALGVVAWALAGGPGPAATPSPSPAAVITPRPETPAPTLVPTAAPSSPSAEPGQTAPATPGGTPTGDVRAEIDAVVAQVPPLRQLEPLREVPYDFVTREQFQVDLQEIIDEETDPAELATEERMLKRLGLLPDDIDLREAILELYGSQVAAFYEPENGTFYIIGAPQTLAPFDQMVVAHEYVHALQDQHFDLEGSRITDPSEGDAALAQTAAIEGDATLLMILWGQRNLTQEELLSIGDDLNPADLELLERMPPILRRQLEFPYSDGLFFSLAVFGASFDWGAIDETVRTPPLSTEQILHPDKYLAGEAPISVELPDLTGALGQGWERTYTQTMGELNTQVWVAAGEEPIPGVPGMPPQQPHAEAAAGWGGDRLAMYETDDDRWALLWELTWDTPEDAGEFTERVRALQQTLDGESQLEEVGEDRVRLLMAHDQSTLDVLIGALEE